MAELLADLKLRWYDESNLLLTEPRELLEAFLDSIGVTSDVARDMFEVMVLANAQDVGLSTSEVKKGMVELRKRRKAQKPGYGLTDRNIQVWLKYFERIGLFENSAGRHRFSSNKKPSKAFERTREVAAESLKYSGKILSKLEQAYGI